MLLEEKLSSKIAQYSLGSMKKIVWIFFYFHYEFLYQFSNMFVIQERAMQ